MTGKTILRAIKNPRHAFLRLAEVLFAYRLSDRSYLKLIYFIQFGRRLNLKNPTTFNEKLSWLKLYGRRKVYTTMADKFEVKQYVANIVGGVYS